MGENAQLVLDGTLCEVCGNMVGDFPEAVGYPRKCDDCRGKAKGNNKKVSIPWNKYKNRKKR